MEPLFRLALSLDPPALLPEEAISAALAADTPAWVHINANHAEARAWISAHLGPERDSAIEALLAQNTRPAYLPQPSGGVLILRGVNLNEGAEPEDMISIRA